MEEWFSRFFQDLQLQLGLRDPKLTAPERISPASFGNRYRREHRYFIGWQGWACRRTQGSNASGGTGSVYFSGFCGIPCRDPAALDGASSVLERMDVPYSDYEDFEKQISDLPDWIKRIDTISAFMPLNIFGTQWQCRTMVRRFSVRERCRSSSGTGRAVQGTAAYSKSSGDRVCRL